jgi:hypothetical protein
MGIGLSAKTGLRQQQLPPCGNNLSFTIRVRDIIKVTIETLEDFSWPFFRISSTSKIGVEDIDLRGLLNAIDERSEHLWSE